MAMVAALLSTGCSTYRVIRIPDTPDALDAFKQCAETKNTPKMESCMADIPGTSDTGILTNKSQWTVPQGCRRLLTDFDRKLLWGADNYSIQACEDSDVPTPPPATVDPTISPAP